MTIKIDSIHPIYADVTIKDSQTPEFIHIRYEVYYTLYLKDMCPLRGETTIEHLMSLEAMESIIEHKIKTANKNETNQSK